MKFHKHLYISDSLKNPGKIKWKLRINAGLPGVYVIALATGPDQLEFYDAALLKQKNFRRLNPPHVVGLATSHAEAMEIVQKITAECYDKTGGADIKAYLKGVT